MEKKKVCTMSEGPCLQHLLIGAYSAHFGFNTESK